MKLRNLLLTAALFVTATATFAKSFQDYDDYIWTNKEKLSTVNVSLRKFQNQTGYSYSVFDVDAAKSILAKANAAGITFNNENQRSKYVIDELKKQNKIWDLKNPGKNNVVTTAIVSPKGTYVEHFGVIEQKVLSVPNISNNYYFYQFMDTPENIVFYGYPTENEGHGNDLSAQITFGAPLPAPVVTLLIALGFGAALVMYRNRKQVKA